MVNFAWYSMTDELELNFRIGSGTLDKEKINEKLVQTFTDEHIKIIDTKVEAKEKEIMTI